MFSTLLTVIRLHHTNQHKLAEMFLQLLKSKLGIGSDLGLRNNFYAKMH